MINKLIEKYQSLSVQLRATVWFFICSVLQRGISVITTPIFTRILSPEEYGQFGVFNSWLSIVTVFVTFQLAAGVYTMGIVKFKEEEKVFTSSLQGLNFVLCVVWTGIYLLFKEFWNGLFSLTTVQMLSMLLMIWSAAAFNFWMTTQRNQYKYKAMVIVTLLVSLAKPILGILFVLNAEDKVTARILSLALVEVVAYSGFFAIQLWRGKKFCSWKFWKYAVLFNLPLIPHYLAGTILGSSDKIMIERMVGASAAGIYNLAFSLSHIMQMVNDSLNKTMSPWLYQKMRSQEYHLMPKVVYPCLAIIAVANLCLIAVAPEIIAVFAPPEYSAAIYVIPPISMSVYANYLYLCFAPFEFYYEKRIWTTIGTVSSAIVNIGLNFLLIPIFGFVAAGYTTVICQLFNAIMHYFVMRRVCKTYIGDLKPYNPKALIGISGGFIALGLLYIPTYGNVFIRYGFTAVLLLILFWKREYVKQMVQGVLKKGAS